MNKFCWMFLVESKREGGVTSEDALTRATSGISWGMDERACLFTIEVTTGSNWKGTGLVVGVKKSQIHIRLHPKDISSCLDQFSDRRLIHDPQSDTFQKRKHLYITI